MKVIFFSLRSVGTQRLNRPVCKTDLVDKQTLLFKPYIYGTPNSADQSETFGVALIFTYSVVLQLCVYI